MNKSYKVLFNTLRGVSAVVSEITSSKQSRKKATVVASALVVTLMCSPQSAYAGLVKEIDGKTISAETASSQSKTGENSVAIGLDASATGKQSVALGKDASALGDYSTAIGYGTVAEGSYSIAMGGVTKATAYASTAMGYNTYAKGQYSFAVGSWSRAYGAGSVALGYSVAGTTGTAADTTMYATAMGYDTEASGQYSTAMGYDTEASGQYSTATGAFSQAIGIGSFAGGYGTSTSTGSQALGQGSFAFGTGAQAGRITGGAGTKQSPYTYGGDNSIAMGFNSKAYGDNSLAMIGGTANGENAIAIGKGATAEANAVALGTNSVAAEGVVSVGYYTNNDDKLYRRITNVADGSADTDAATYGQVKAKVTNLAIGDNASTAIAIGGTDKKSSFFGESAKESADFGAYSTAMGQYSVASGVASTAMGYATNASGLYSTATGAYSQAIGDGAFAGGSTALMGGAIAYGKSSFAFGAGATTGTSETAGANQIAMGNGSKAIGTNSLALIGGKASGENAIAIGSSSEASGKNSVAIGSSASVTETNSIAIGVGAKSEVANRVTIASIVSDANKETASQLDVDQDGVCIGQRIKTGNVVQFANLEVNAETGIKLDSENVLVTGDMTVKDVTAIGQMTAHDMTATRVFSNSISNGTTQTPGSIANIGTFENTGSLSNTGTLYNTGDFVQTGDAIFQGGSVSIAGNTVFNSNYMMHTGLLMNTGASILQSSAGSSYNTFVMDNNASMLYSVANSNVKGYIVVNGYGVGLGGVYNSNAAGTLTLTENSAVMKAGSSTLTITDSGVSVSGKLTVSSGIDANGKSITNVGSAGTLSSTNTNAVNGADLYANLTTATTTSATPGNYYAASSTITVAVDDVDTAIGKVVTGNYVKSYDTTSEATIGNTTLAKNINNLDAAIGTWSTTTGSNGFLTAYDAANAATTSVGANLSALDAALTTTNQRTTGISYSNDNGADLTTIDNNLTVSKAVKAASFAVDDKIYITSSGINANAQQITNVASAGVLSSTNTSAVNGADLYAVSTSVTTATTMGSTAGSYYAAGASVTDAVEAVDKAIGKDADTGNFINKNQTNTVSTNLRALDTALGDSTVSGAYINKAATNTVYSNLKALDVALTEVSKGSSAIALGTASTVGQIVDSTSTSTGDASLGLGTVNSNSNTEQNDGGAIALGQGSSVVSKTGSIAIGQGSTVLGTKSIAVGVGHEVRGNKSGAFGDPSIIYGTESYAFGNNNVIGTTVSANTNAFIVGNNNTVTGNNTFVLGSNVTTDASNAVVLGNNSAAVSNAVSVGSATNQRQIKYVATPTDATDAANKYYVDSSLNRLDNSLTKKVNRLGAKSAAISALHPMGLDEDHKFSASAGLGTYGGQSAAAVGLFYKPNENWMFNVGGAAGKGSVMGNIGFNYRFGAPGSVKAVSTSQVAAQVVALQDTNRSIEAQLKSSISREEGLVKRITHTQQELQQAKKREQNLVKKFEDQSKVIANLLERINRLETASKAGKSN